MYEALKYRIVGTAPLICNNVVHSLDPFDPLKRAISEITAKTARKRTDDDHLRMRKIEWLMGLYVDDDEHAIIPGENIESMIRDGAKKARKGKDMTAGIVVPESPRIEYKGPKKPDEMFDQGRQFVDLRAVKNAGSGGRVLRCRPIFRDWALDITVNFAPSQVSASDVDKALEQAGAIVGLGDFRPKFGRFTAKRI